MNLHELASYYVNHCGFSVMPLAFRSKEPLKGFSWKGYQSKKPEQKELDAWFRGRRRNLAIITGAVSQNLLVLDFDDQACFQSWQQHTQVKTLRCETGRGVHCYFQIQDIAVLPRGSDFYVDGCKAGQVKSNGGYVVAPPSIHPSGNRYTWHKSPLAVVSLADIGVDFGVSKQGNDLALASRSEHLRAAGVPGDVKFPQLYALAAIEQESAKIAGTAEGTRNQVLFMTARNVKRFEGILTADDIQGALIQAGRQAGLSDQEATKTVVSAWSHL